jgi:hypothetical protein
VVAGDAALCRFNGRKERCWGMRRLCRSAGHTGVCGEKVLAGKDNVAASAMEGDGRWDLLGARQRDGERALARKEFAFERVVSCGQRWRTKLNFRSQEPFDDRHRGTTLRTAPSVAELGGGSISLELLLWRCPQ